MLWRRITKWYVHRLFLALFFAWRIRIRNITNVGLVDNCQRKNRPLERVMGEKIGEIFQKKLEESGVKFKMGASVAKATSSSSSSSKSALYI